MNTIWLYALGSTALISLIAFIGIFTLSIKAKTLQKVLIYMISFSAGALLGDAFLHLLPEIVNEVGFTLNISLYILLGISIFFIVEKFIHWRHCHHPTTDDHPHPYAIMNLFGDAVHNFIDGLIIGAAYLVDIKVGIATTIAVVLHEIPQEIGDFGILIHGGFSKGKALLLNFATAIVAVLGTVIALIIGTHVEGMTTFLIPFTAGGFIYIASADLIPELHKKVDVKTSSIQLVTFALGILIMVGLMFSHSHSHENEINHDKDHNHQHQEIIFE